jgi:parallel beta-helix repeat protein
MLWSVGRAFRVLVAACVLFPPSAAAEPGQSPGTVPFVDCSSARSAPSLPIVDVRTFGALGNGVDDDSRAILDAIGSLHHGGTILFPPGTYRHGDTLAVRPANVTLAGSDATLLAGNPSRAAILLEGENSAIRSLTIASEPPGERGDRNEQSGVVVSGHGNAVLGNIVRGFKNAGILVVGARNYVIACNRVFDTKSDGIHSTDGASDGYVVHNSVVNSGDDGIAVVSYRTRPQASSVTIEDNSVEHIRWGRGISVIGSTDVVIRRNRIRSVAMAAGIIVAREASYDTPGARNVIIESNTIVDVQRSLAPLAGRDRTGHGAIELNSDSDGPELGVSDVSVVGNSVEGSGYDGIRLHGNVSRIVISANRLSNVGGHAIALGRKRSDQVLQCRDNTIERDAVPCE